MTKGEETRTAILDTALAMASRTGLEALSIGALAKEAGMSKSGLFAHFESKEKLQVAVLETAVERFVQTVVQPAMGAERGEPRVRALFANCLAWERASFHPGGCIFNTAANEFDDRPGPVRDVILGYQKRWLEVLARAARIAVEEGHFRADLDADQFAYEAFALYLGYHLYRRLLEDPEADNRVHNSFERLIRDCRAWSGPRKETHDAGIGCVSTK